jgi:hypothetical protein
MISTCRSVAAPPCASATDLLHVAAASVAGRRPGPAAAAGASAIAAAAAGGPKAWGSSQRRPYCPPASHLPFLFAAPKRATAPPLAGHHPSTLPSCPQLKPHRGSKPGLALAGAAAPAAPPRPA